MYKTINEQTKRDYPTQSIQDCVRRACLLAPEKVAVLSSDDTLTYRDLEERSEAVANYLYQEGVRTGDLVGLCCDRYVDTPVLLLGILKSGAGYVPLDPAYPVDRLRYMVDNSQLKRIIANTSQNDLTQHFDVPTLVIDKCWDAALSSGKRPDQSCQPREDVAYVIYTSGSTGQPKGVVVQHQAVVNFLLSMQERPGFVASDRLLATTTLSFDISVLEMFLPLIAGGSVAIVDRETARDASALADAMLRYNVNFVQATPAMWRMIVEAEFPGRPDMKFLTGGEPLPRDLIRPMLERCGELWNVYGPTETTVWSTAMQIESDQGQILIGKPIANTQIYIVDEQGELCSTETPGELLIGGEGVTLGYHNRPELTTERFCNFHGRRVYRTGDLARVTESGDLVHMGRIDSQIKFNGHRIELDEIDAALAKQTGVRQAATVLREDQPGAKRLVSYLIPSGSGPLDLSQVRDGVARDLPSYMVPNLLVSVDAFHYTPSGKLDRKSFPAPSTDRPDLAEQYAAPKTDQEKRLAAIWQEQLQLDRVGTLDNFFELGGNSILAAQIVTQAEKELGIKVAPAEFFDNPTIQGFLSLADRKQKTTLLRQTRKRRLRENENGGFAIVGMAVRMPGAADLQAYWDNLANGRESITRFRPEELDPTLPARDTQSASYVPARGIVQDADMFDARFFGIPPRNAEVMDPQQRIVLELAWTALEDAGIVPSKTDATIGVWAGAYATNYFTKNIMSSPDLLEEFGEFNAGLFNEKDYIATRVAHALNLTGPAINVNTACSTSLVALIDGCRSLDVGDCDVAIAGGVSVAFPQHSGHLHQSGSIFTPDGHCRPFDAAAAGTMFSDGAGLVVVKRLADAIADGDRIYSVVKGYGINNDGGDKASFSAPSITGQASAIAMAQAMADVPAESISYVEAHGTATPIGDPIEVTALRSVFESQTDKKQFCGIGSVKSNIGHTVAAAGVAGLTKVALAMHHENIPATLHYTEANPQIDFENSPFFVCDRAREWPRNDQPRRAAVSSFGVGGTNAHIVLEEAPLDVARRDEGSLPLAVLPVSAKSKASLAANATELATCLEGLAHPQLHDVASVLTHGRDDFPFRGVVIAQSATEAAAALNKQTAPQFRSRRAAPRERDVVFMFPGQGAQYVRMGQDLYEHSSVFRESIDRCATVLEPLLGRDLRSVLFPTSGDEEAAQEILRNTRFTQPALFTLGYSLARLWQSWGIKPAALVGHSIGEFAAACVAGVFKLEDALKIIAERGRAIEQLPRGGMLSVRLPGSEVETLLTGDLAVGSYNGPQLCVVSGPSDQIAGFEQLLEKRGVAAKLLHTSHAFHSPMMSPIVDSFAEFIQRFELSAPETPILSTVTGKWLTAAEAIDARYWANHLCAPVQFSEAVTTLWDAQDGDSSRILLELGPRRTLATLAMQHATNPKEQLAVATLSDNAADHAEWRATLEAVATLWLSGINVDWAHVTPSGKSSQHKHMSLPTYQFERKRFFIEPASKANETTMSISDGQPAAPAAIKQYEPTPETQESLTVNRRPNIVEAVQRVFESTSGVDLTDFDGETTFFEMGLDSLVLTQTAAAFDRELGIEVTFRQLLENTTNVDALAEWIDESVPSERFQSEPAASSIEQPTTEPPVVVHAPAAATLPGPSTDSVLPVQPVVSPGAVAMPVASQQQSNGNTFGLSELAQMQLQSQLQLMNQQMQLFAGQPVSPAAPTQAAPIQARTIEAVPAQMAVASHERAPASTLDSAAASGSVKPAGALSETSDELAPKAKRFKTVRLNEGELDERQQAALDEMTRSNCAMMRRSKAYAQEHRRYMADPRTVSGFRPNLKEMTHPIVVDRSSGVHLWDVDGNQYTDFTCGFGSNILGHAHEKIVDAISRQVQQDYSIGPQSPLAGEVAKLFCEVTGHQRMAFANTGSEAVLGCTRLARNYTGRDLVVMFNGDYHGILDEVIVRGSKKLKSFPAASGIPKEHVGNTLILDYGSDESLQIIEQNMSRIAAVLVEPVQSRRPELQPREFLQKLGKLTQDDPAALIFDEVITGLRIGLGGAQEHFGVKADLASYGKIVGGGMPIGIVAGNERYMDGLDGGFWNYSDESRPEAAMTYFAGTFVRHPLTLAASKAILEHLKDGGKPMYDGLNRLADYLGEELNKVFEQLDAPLRLEHFGSLFKIQFEQELAYSEVFFAGLRRRGMHIWDHRPCLLTFEHKHEHIDDFAKAAYDTIVECQQFGFMPGEGYKSAKVQSDQPRPPQVNAKAGTDDQGKPGWFVPDAQNPGQYLQVGLPQS